MKIKRILLQACGCENDLGVHPYDSRVCEKLVPPEMDLEVCSESYVRYDKDHLAFNTNFTLENSGAKGVKVIFDEGIGNTQLNAVEPDNLECRRCKQKLGELTDENILHQMDYHSCSDVYMDRYRE